MGRRTLLLIASILVAAAGTALVWLYAQGAESRARAGTQQVYVWVATSSIDAGTGRDQLVDGVVERRLMTMNDAPPDRVVSLNDLGTKSTTQRILKGQPLILSQFGPATSAGVKDGRMALSLTMPDPNRVAGLLRPESLVAVYFVATDTAKAKSNGNVAVDLLLDQVRVIAIGSTTSAVTALGAPARVGTQAGVPTAVVTLDVSGLQATKLLAAQTTGQLYFALLGNNAKGQAGDGVTGNTLLAR
jgi:pilus assembly protein CpaB